MRLEAWTYRCTRDGTFFDAATRAPSGGRLLRSTGRGALRHLELHGDPVFVTLSARLEALLGREPRGSPPGHRTRELFSVTVDPDADGSPFVIGAPPSCPRCGGRDVVLAASTDPARFVDEDAPEVTHRRWASMSPAEQDAALREAARR